MPPLRHCGKTSRAAGGTMSAGSFAHALTSVVKRPDGKAGRALDEYFDELETAVESLIERVQQLEAAAAESGAMKFRGGWSAPNLYHFGDVVLRDGQPWHCNSRGGTTARPGTSDDWTLMHKSEPSMMGARQLAGSRGKGTPR